MEFAANMALDSGGTAGRGALLTVFSQYLQVHF